MMITYVSAEVFTAMRTGHPMSWILEEMVLEEDGSHGSHGAAPWAGLLDGFRKPRKIVDAVVEFSRERGLDPEATLDEVFPVLRRLLAAGLLLPARPRGVPSSSAAARRLASGRELVDAEIRSSKEEAAGHSGSSLTFGAAGVAYGLWHVARSRRDGALLEEAAARLRESTPALAEGSPGRVSPYHGSTGLFAARALVAEARGDPPARDQAVAAFAGAAREPCEKLDLTRGQAGALLGACLLAQALGREARPPLFELGREMALRIRHRLAGLAPIRDDRSVAFLGIAHGWGGLLYALLAWSKVSGSRLEADVEGRLAELAELGHPHGRGLRWRRILGSRDPPRYMSSWCNGAAGLVHLWILAHGLTGEDPYLDLAERGAWNAWEDGGTSWAHLCCGLSGRAYSLLAFYRTTGETVWLDRARRLAAAAMDAGYDPQGSDHSLYKGRWGPAVLLADLEEPMSAAMPFFELSPNPRPFERNPRSLVDKNQSQMVKKFR